MVMSLSRGAAAVGLAAASAVVTLAVAPAASAVGSPKIDGSVQCRTQINSSATAGTGTTSTRCTKDRTDHQAALTGRGSGTVSSVRPGSRAPRSFGSTSDLRGWSSTGLHFRNSTSSTVSVTIMYFDPDGCAGYGDWGTQGWWNIAPGQEVNVKNTSNRYATFYAHSDRLEWAGAYDVYVKSSAFKSCVNIGSTDSRIVGERLVDLGDVTALPYTTYTVNLTE